MFFQFNFKLPGKIFWLAVFLVCLSPAGCSKAKSRDAVVNANVFETASPQLKSDWEKIISASATNGYVVAILTCRKLQAQPDLAADQRAAVDQAMTDTSNRMTAAADKGDQAAAAAIAELRKRWRE